VVLGDSDQLVVGETVSTIGNALGAYSYSQTSGSVSATGRSVTMSDGTVMNMIQTDCTINSGNSGGPLFDQYGRVVGITSAKLSSGSDTSVATIEGMGFAIPLNDVIDIITDYMQYGYVTGRPYMGITVRTVETDYQQAFGWPAGVYVNTVEDGSCAQSAGLKVGDIITKVGDTEVTSMAELSSAKNTYKAGETTTLTVYRSGETITLTITFDEQVNNTQTSTSDSSTSNGDSSTQDPNAQETASNGNNYGNGNSNGGYGYGGSNGGYGSFPFGG
jgi:serine protease Do